MYQRREQSCFFIAVLYYIVYMLGLLLMGILYQKQSVFRRWPYYILFLVCFFIVLVKDKSLGSLGFTKEKLKPNLLISLVIVLFTFGTSVILYPEHFVQLVQETIYYVFEIALVEEVIFRGLLQSYLFGSEAPRRLVFAIGAVMFSLSHLPFQMYLHNDVSWGYVMGAMPQLIYTFLFHLFMCWITEKRKDILIPVALHYVTNYINFVGMLGAC